MNGERTLATAEQATSLGERVSRIEGGYEHLATKADLARLETKLSRILAGSNQYIYPNDKN